MREAEFTLENLEATNALGQRLGALLFTGAVIGLEGILGAGKTHLCRAIAVGLGVTNPLVVNSPTFVLMQQYMGRCLIHHFDVYRLKSTADFLDLGLEDLYPVDGVSLIEWADRIRAVLPEEYLYLRLTTLDENRRLLQIQAFGPSYESLLAQLQCGVAQHV